MNSSNITTATTIPTNVAFSGLTIPYYIRAVVTSFGMLTNLINTCVFLNAKLKDTSYKYMLVMSINNFVYLTLLFMAVFFVNCINCPSSTTYFAAAYTIAIGYYVCTSMAVFRILLECIVSMHTYCVLINRTRLINKRMFCPLLIVFAFVASFALYCHFAFSYAIVQSTSQVGLGVVYTVITGDFGNSSVGRTEALVTFVIRLVLAVFVLTLMNLANLFKFKKRYNNKRTANINSIQMTALNNSLTPNTQKTLGTNLPPTNLIETNLSLENGGIASVSNLIDFSPKVNKIPVKNINEKNSMAVRNIAIMVIATSFNNAIGTSPYAIYYILVKSIFTLSQVSGLYETAVILLYLSPD